MLLVLWYYLRHSTMFRHYLRVHCRWYCTGREGCALWYPRTQQLYVFFLFVCFAVFPCNAIVLPISRCPLRASSLFVPFIYSFVVYHIRWLLPLLFTLLGTVCNAGSSLQHLHAIRWTKHTFDWCKWDIGMAVRVVFMHFSLFPSEGCGESTRAAMNGSNPMFRRSISSDCAVKPRWASWLVTCITPRFLLDAAIRMQESPPQSAS